ncbi:MAG: GDSL-type esterase/lipase family protein [Gemmataceae bacterium]
MLGIVALTLTLNTLHAPPAVVACIGDSITWGAVLPDREKQAYPAVLGRLLGDEYSVKNFGINGRTVLAKGDKPYTDTQEYKDALASQPRVVVICLGTNDTRPNNWKHADDFVTDYTNLVKSFTALKPAPKVFVCTPPPAFPGEGGIETQRIKLGVVPKVQEVAKDQSLTVIDLFEACTGKSNLFPDKVHPNPSGAALIARTVKKAIAGE